MLEWPLLKTIRNVSMLHETVIEQTMKSRLLLIKELICGTIFFQMHLKQISLNSIFKTTLKK